MKEGKHGLEDGFVSLEKVAENLVGFAPSAEGVFEAFIIEGKHGALGFVEGDAVLGFLEKLECDLRFAEYSKGLLVGGVLFEVAIKAASTAGIADLVVFELEVGRLTPKAMLLL